MAGTFSVGESKTRPGVYHRRYSVGGGEVAGALNGVGMGIIRANWGPLNRAVAFEPSTNVNAVFGSGNTEDLITEMFSGGISSGYFVRCGTGGTAPTITLKDNAKADVVTITGAYVGDRAFSVSVRDSLTGDGRECIIYEGTTEFLKVTFEADTKEPAGLAAAINAATKDFVAKATAAGSGVMATVSQLVAVVVVAGSIQGAVDAVVHLLVIEGRGVGRAGVISIHALREEGDLRSQAFFCRFVDFYPRPPRGGRQQKQRQNLYFQTNYTTFCTNLEEP